MTQMLLTLCVARIQSLLLHAGQYVQLGSNKTAMNFAVNQNVDIYYCLTVFPYKGGIIRIIKMGSLSL